MSRPDQQGAAGPVLHGGDLVDDRELVDVDRDRLDHERIAIQLVDLVTTVDMPTNVALYGPWGSGKTGIANIIKAKLDDRAIHKNVKFARFDAFKYAENPLRRNFISAVATELNIKDDKYGKDLYAGKTTTRINVPKESKFKIGAWFIGLTLALILALLVIIAILSAIQDGPWRTNFGANFSAALPAALISPALLAAVFTLVGRTLTVDRSVDKPDSVEQFENIFRDLVAQSKADRLVIFVDELDRCTAKEVVTTLDAVRTFLGVDKCVFVVAADQHVLEQALSEEARQETPSDSVNPYYSTGSAYLDKVFQYQISLPPLLPHSVTDFAINAVKDNGGLWEELTPVDYVVSILVPSHVTSPRRVKHLLNTFALTYRLAQAKHAAGRLQEDPHKSALAIARLVCLRVEFPNFARDLMLDPDLPAHVLTLKEDQNAELGPRVPAYVRERALAYATGLASPARLLTQSDPDDDPDDLDAGPTGSEENEDEATTGASTDKDAAPAQDGGARAQQGRQLLTYLTRTRLIDGPSRDLIYLHSVGSVYDLPDDLARDLGSALDDGQFTEVRRLYRDADASDQRNALLFIAGQIGATFGIERLNDAHALLDLIQHQQDLDLNAIADTAGQVIASMHQSGEAVLTEDTTPGAWALATASEGEGAMTLRRIVLSVLASNPGWDASYLLNEPLAAVETDAEATRTILGRELTSGRAPKVTNLLTALDETTAERVLNLVRHTAGEDLASQFQDLDEQIKAVKRANEESAEQAAATGAEPDEAAQQKSVQVSADLDTVVNALKTLAEHWSPDHKPLAWTMTHILLLGDHEKARVAVSQLLPELGPAPDGAIAKSLLTSVRPRPTSEWKIWLSAVPVNVVDEEHDVQLQADADWLLSRATTDVSGESVGQVRAAVDELKRLVENRPAGTIDLTEHALEAAGGPVTSEEEATSRVPLIELVEQFIAPGFVSAPSFAQHELNSMRQTLATAIAAQPETGELTRYVVNYGPHIAGFYGEPAEDEIPELLALAQDTAQCSWLPEPLRSQASTAILADSHEAMRDQARQQAIAFEQLVELITTHQQAASDTVSHWVRLMLPDRATSQTILEAVQANGGVTATVAHAMSETTHEWSDETERITFAQHFIGQSDQGLPDENIRQAVDFEHLDPEGLVDILVTRFNQSGSNTAKEVVTKLWKLSPLGDQQAHRLYNDILMPWLGTNTGGQTNVDAVKRSLRAVQDLETQVPADLRDDFADLVVDAAGRDRDLIHAAIPTLAHLNYSADRVGVFRSRLEVSDDQEE